MVRKSRGIVLLVLLLGFTGTLLAQQNQDIPDAPSATRPVPPPAPPSIRPTPEPADAQPAPPKATDNAFPQPKNNDDNAFPEPKTSPPGSLDNSGNADQPAPPSMPPITTVPEGSVPPLGDQSPGYTIRKNVDYVVVPVMVKDTDGRLVNGLQPKDFSVLENGQRQSLKFFTSDPFPLSAAVIFDLGMPDVAVQRINETLPALQGAFSQFDEVSVYTYSSTVSQVSDFAAAGQSLTAVLNQLKTYTGRNNGPPVTSGPLGPQGPVINGRPIDSPVVPVSTPPKEVHVINDAILRAARDLSKRDRGRRKIIFVISDGRERGSIASFSDTLKVLLTQNIIVYAVGVDSAAIPGYSTVQKLRIPKLGIGYGNILPKYVNATGGGTVYSEYAKAEIERAYASAIGDARNQYTLAYTPKTGIGGYRQIEVRVRRPDVKVYAKDGYYPLPVAH